MSGLLNRDVRHKINMRHIYLYIAAAVMLTTVLTSCASKRPSYPTMEKIADTWIGFNEDDLYYYRLTLNTNGTGICANTFVNDPARLYRVTQWDLNGYNIGISLEPIDANAEPIWMKGETTGWHLNLKIGGKTLKWKRDLKMYRESDANEKYERVKARMQKAEQWGPGFPPQVVGSLDP